MRDVRPPLRAALRRAGIRFGPSPEKLDDALRGLMGPRRFERHLELLNGYAEGSVASGALYASIQGPEEAALFQSHEAETLLECGVRLYDSVLRTAASGARVLELGCFGGALLSAYAALRPDLIWIGADRARGMIASARSAYGGVARWIAADYSALTARRAGGPVDVVVATSPVNFAAADPPCAPRGTLSRAAAVHRVVGGECFEFFAAARRAASPGASFAAAFRAPTAARAFAIADAAAAAGIRMDEARSSAGPAGGDRFLFLAGDVAESSPPAPAPFLSWWRGRMRTP